MKLNYYMMTVIQIFLERDTFLMAGKYATENIFLPEHNHV